MTRAWSDWDLPKWLSVLENRHRDEIKLGLDRILDAAKALGLDKPQCKVITVGGTNGKGSTATALETIYTTAGYRVGAYTSPHLLRYNERIRLNTKPIDDAALCEAFCVIEAGRGDVILTYFETATLAALWYFKQLSVDVIILEVGLGGRLDATNIIDADLAVITTIDFDHQQFLGDTLEAIGAEKAGILRAEKPLIYADDNPPDSILNKANTLKAPTYLFNEDYFCKEQANNWVFSGLDCQLELPKPTIQLKAAAAAVAACLLLQQYLPVEPQHIATSMKTIFIAGRLQLFPGEINVLLDVSHNPQSARLLADKLRGLKTKGKVHAVFSALGDKDIFGVIQPVKDCVDHWYPAQLEYNRAASVDQLLTSLEQAEIVTNLCYTSPLVAFETAVSKSKSGDLIVVFGSFFTVSHVLSAEYFTRMQKEI